jgi:hypothetical protein
MLESNGYGVTIDESHRQSLSPTPDGAHPHSSWKKVREFNDNGDKEDVKTYPIRVIKALSGMLFSFFFRFLSILCFF